jgi:hypothetical protein
LETGDEISLLSVVIFSLKTDGKISAVCNPAKIAKNSRIGKEMMVL